MSRAQALQRVSQREEEEEQGPMDNMSPITITVSFLFNRTTHLSHISNSFSI
jgi:hypothetical protein